MQVVSKIWKQYQYKHQHQQLDISNLQSFCFPVACFMIEGLCDDPLCQHVEQRLADRDKSSDTSTAPSVPETQKSVLAGVGPNSEIIGNVRILEKFFGHFDKHQKSSLHTNFECVGGF